MIDTFLADPTIRMLEQTMSFTEQRHNVLLEDIANASTPGFVQARRRAMFTPPKNAASAERP